MKFKKYEFGPHTYIDVVTDTSRVTLKRMPFGTGEWYFHADYANIPVDSWLQASNSLSLITCKFDESDLMKVALTFINNKESADNMINYIKIINDIKNDELFLSKLAAYFLFDYTEELGINPFVRNKSMYDQCNAYIDKLDKEDKLAIAHWFVEYYGEALKYIKSVSPMLYGNGEDVKTSAIEIFAQIHDNINSFNELVMKCAESSIDVFDYISRMPVGQLYGSINLKLKISEEESARAKV
jgi:hypothetical protein